MEKLVNYSSHETVLSGDRVRTCTTTEFLCPYFLLFLTNTKPWHRY